MLIDGGAFTQPCGISTSFWGEDSNGNSYENWMSVQSYIMILYDMEYWYWKSIVVTFLFRKWEMHVFSVGRCYDCISWSSGYFARCLIQYEGRSISIIMVLLVDITFFCTYHFHEKYSLFLLKSVESHHYLEKKTSSGFHRLSSYPAMWCWDLGSVILCVA